MQSISLMILLPLSTTIALTAQTYEATCIQVVDGDTVVVESDGYKLRVNLYGIDAPHKRTQDGQKAMDRLKSLILDETITVREIEKDSYGTWLVDITAGGTNVNATMVKEGYAYRVPRETKSTQSLKQAEKQAKATGKNLWSKKPEPEHLDKESQVDQYGSGRLGNPPDYKVKVYTNSTGKFYHRFGCRELKNHILDTTLQNAKARDLKPCEQCDSSHK